MGSLSFTVSFFLTYRKDHYRTFRVGFKDILSGLPLLLLSFVLCLWSWLFPLTADYTGFLASRNPESSHGFSDILYKAHGGSFEPESLFSSYGGHGL